MAKLLLIDNRVGLFMRLLMILGGLIGFLIGLALGAAQGAALPQVIWRSSVAAFVAGVVLRWWGKVWLSSLHKELEARAVAAAAKFESKSEKL
jgi:hypothetical protein